MKEWVLLFECGVLLSSCLIVHHFTRLPVNPKQALQPLFLICSTVCSPYPVRVCVHVTSSLLRVITTEGITLAFFLAERVDKNLISVNII